MSQARSTERSELSRRIMVGAPVMGVVIGTIILSQTLLAVLVLLFGYYCLYEYSKLIERPRRPEPNLLPLNGIIFTVVVVAARFWTFWQMLGVLVVAYLEVMLVNWGMPRLMKDPATPPWRGTLRHHVSGFGGLFWIGFPLACAVLLRGMHHGSWLVADVVIVVSASDTGAYLGGKAIGRHKMAPRISPGKTWEGWVTGILTAILAIYLLSLLQSWLPLWQALVFGATVAVISSLGDLFESFIKRRAGVKDSGTLFGAHGGALDRADAIFFGAFAGYALAQLFGL